MQLRNCWDFWRAFWSMGAALGFMRRNRRRREGPSELREIRAMCRVAFPEAQVVFRAAYQAVFRVEAQVVFRVDKK